jgi:hypothetical protein
MNSLRADREAAQALDAAGFVIENLTEQIRAFQHVLAAMRENLDQLDAAERERIEGAATTLRKARAGTALPLTVVQHPNRDKADDTGI